MSSTQFYNGRMIMDYTGKLAPTRIRIDQNQSEEASAALSNICNALSAGQQLVETGEYTDYKTVTTFPDNSAINYNVYRLTLIDNVDDSVKEYVYIPSAKLSLLTNNLDYIPSSSTIFTQIANYIQPYYRSRLNNLCTLTAIEYVNQRNTIFPSQVGTATFAPKQVKEISVISNGQTIVNPDSGYILGRVIINTNVPETPTQSAEETYTANGEYNILPDIGYALDSVLITVNVPPPKVTRFKIGNNIYLMNELTRVEANTVESIPREVGSSTFIIYALSSGNYGGYYTHHVDGGSSTSQVFTYPWYYYHTTNGDNTFYLLSATEQLFEVISNSSASIGLAFNKNLLTFEFTN